MDLGCRASGALHGYAPWTQRLRTGLTSGARLALSGGKAGRRDDKSERGQNRRADIPPSARDHEIARAARPATASGTQTARLGRTGPSRTLNPQLSTLHRFPLFSPISCSPLATIFNHSRTCAKHGGYRDGNVSKICRRADISMLHAAERETQEPI